MAAMMANVLAAFFSLGILKNGTALLIASTPVSELDPLENARKIKAIETPGIAAPTKEVALYGIAPVATW